jgi:hypothetical protein
VVNLPRLSRYVESFILPDTMSGIAARFPSPM